MGTRYGLSGTEVARMVLPVLQIRYVLEGVVAAMPEHLYARNTKPERLDLRPVLRERGADWDEEMEEESGAEGEMMELDKVSPYALPGTDIRAALRHPRGVVSPYALPGTDTRMASPYRPTPCPTMLLTYALSMRCVVLRWRTIARNGTDIGYGATRTRQPS
eukprot:1827170-Rhodomonas_salina.1